MTEKTTADPRTADQKPDATEGQSKERQSKPETPVSDKQIPKDGTGEHGRPTDDSDPGHS